MSWIKYVLRRLWLAVSGQSRWLAGPSPADNAAVEAHCDELWAESQAAIQAAIYWGEEPQAEAQNRFNEEYLEYYCP